MAQRTNDRPKLGSDPIKPEFVQEVAFSWRMWLRSINSSMDYLMEWERERDWASCMERARRADTWTALLLLLNPCQYTTPTLTLGTIQRIILQSPSLCNPHTSSYLQGIRTTRMTAQSIGITLKTVLTQSIPLCIRKKYIFD